MADDGWREKLRKNDLPSTEKGNLKTHKAIRRNFEKSSSCEVYHFISQPHAISYAIQGYLQFNLQFLIGFQAKISVYCACVFNFFVL